MNKFWGIILTFFALILIVSCKNRNTLQAQDNEVKENTSESVSSEQSKLIEDIRQYCDSIIMVLPVNIESEKSRISPKCLLSPDAVDNALTLKGKYRILMMLLTDRTASRNYNVNTDKYDEACLKLIRDINDPALDYLYKTSGQICKLGFKDDTKKLLSDHLQKYYNLECENGREIYFWHVVTAAIVEQLYLTTQNLDTEIAHIDDDSASSFSRYLSCIMNDIQKIEDQDDNIKNVVKLLQPLESINATSNAELMKQLNNLRKDIEVSRNNMIE